MQTTMLPKAICEEVDKKCRGFIWGSTEEKKKIHLVKWEKVAQPKKSGGLGIRSMRQANVAFLAKLGWRIMNEEDTLWSRVLRDKYCGGRNDRDMFQPHRSPSHTWKGVLYGAPTLLKGSRSIIGNGMRTLFWYHNWVEDCPLVELASEEVGEDILDCTVGELWGEEGWEWHKFSHLLPSTTLQKIAAVQVCTSMGGDTLSWSRTSSGAFSVKTAMELVRGEAETKTLMNWKAIWNVSAPQKCRTFLWLANHEAFLCNATRMRRKIATQEACEACGETSETCLHVLRDCPRAREIWAALQPPSSYDEFYSGQMREWLQLNLNESANWASTFAMAIWWVWRWRNARSFGHPNDIPHNRHHFILERVSDYNTVSDLKKNSSGQQKRKREEAHIRWVSPPDGWVKLNTDGASKGNPGQAGGGGYCDRLREGIWLHS